MALYSQAPFAHWQLLGLPVNDALRYPSALPLEFRPLVAPLAASARSEVRGSRGFPRRYLRLRYPPATGAFALLSRTFPRPSGYEKNLKDAASAFAFARNQRSSSHVVCVGTCTCGRLTRLAFKLRFWFIFLPQMPAFWSAACLCIAGR